MKKKLTLLLKNSFVFLVILAVISVSTIYTGKDSLVYADTAAHITSYSVSTDHGGEIISGLDDQWINFTVNFSDKISISSSEDVISDLNITLNGTRFTSTPSGSNSYLSYVTVEQGSDQKSLLFKIHIGFAAYAGQLKVQAPNGITSITDAGTGTPVEWSDIDLLVPNGVQLETVSQTAGNPDENINASVTKRVIAPESCTRGMLHMIFLKNGQPVGTLDSFGANVTPHYHDYLNLYADRFASMIPGFFTDFASDYTVTYNGTSVTNDDATVTYNGDTFTITSASSNAGDILDLRIYAYPQVIQDSLDKEALTAAINTAENLDTSIYNESSVKNLRNEIAIAKSMKNSSYYLQNELDEECQILKNTISSLEFKPINLTDSSTGISLIGTAGILPLDTVLSVVKISDTKTLDSIKNSIKVSGGSIEKFNLYNISLTSANTEIQPKGTVQLSIPVPEGFDSNKLAVYHIDDNGNVAKIDFTIENGYIIFSTNSFSYYAIAQIAASSVILSPVNTGDAQIPYYYFGLCLISLSAIIIYSKKSKKGTI